MPTDATRGTAAEVVDTPTNVKREATKPAHANTPNNVKRETAKPTHANTPTNTRREIAGPAHTNTPSNTKRETAGPVHTNTPSNTKRETAARAVAKRPPVADSFFSELFPTKKVTPKVRKPAAAFYKFNSEFLHVEGCGS